MAKSKSNHCACKTNSNRKCNNQYCIRVAVTATREAHLPPGSPGQIAADRLARRLR